MADLSNTNGYITLQQLWDMAKRVDKWYAQYKSNPEKVYLDITTKKDWVLFPTFQDMRMRYVEYVNTKGVEPDKIYFIAPEKTTTNGPPTEKSSFHQAVEGAVGAYKTFTEYYNRIKAKSWEGYYNDIYGLGDEVKRLANNQSLNCTDHSQLGFAVAKDLWYDVRYCRVSCKSGGHIILQVKGYELGSSWVNVDLAAAASSDYNIGTYWCSSYAKPVVIDESWIKSDDGKT